MNARTTLICGWLLVAGAVSPSSVLQIFPSQPECMAKIEDMKKMGALPSLTCVDATQVNLVVYPTAPKEGK